jgi:membrane-associated protease RseP (regulator of RpoE activity)
MLWLLAVFIAYWAIIEILRIKGKLEKYGKNYGPILLLKTAKGLSFVERISKPRLFWKAFATLGIPLMLFGMAVMMALLILADIVMLISPPKPSELTSPQAALLIPGINPFIPLVWGIIGLAVAIVVHELSHAVLCRVEGIRVKSLGIILALFPIGAFAEPEEKELLDRNRSKASKIRVYTAGISANYIVAFIAFALFFSMLPSLNPVVAVVDERGEILGKVVEVNGKPVSGNFDSLVKEGEWNYMLIENDTGRHEIKFYGVFGVKVIGLYREGGTFPAEIAGIKGGTMITKLDGRKVRNIEEFREVMMQKRPGEDVEVETYDPGSGNFDEFRIRLVERDGKAFMGVYLSNYECVGGFNVVNTGNSHFQPS